MKINITEGTVKKDFPNIYKEFREKKKKSKAKGSHVPLSEFEFSFEIAEKIQGCSLNDVLSGKVLKDKREEMTVEERLRKQLKNVFVQIQASYGRYQLRSEVLEEIPEQVEDGYRKSIQEQEEERKRVEALTPEERDKETQVLLRELRKYPGFLEMHIPIER